MALAISHKDSEFRIGDIVRVHQKIQEDAKTRIQVFEGTVMAISGHGTSKSFTVRRIGAGNIGIERIFPIISPVIDKVEVKTPGHVRRAKIYYIRDKSARELAEITRPREAKPQTKGSSRKASSKRKKSKKK